MNKIRRRILPVILVAVGLCSMPAAYIAADTAESSAAVKAVTVYLNRLAVIESNEYTLGQVASIYSPDEKQADALRRLPIASTPRRATLLPPGVIQQRLASVAARAVVIGDRVAILPGAGVPPAHREFYSALLGFVDRQDGLKQGRIEIEILSAPLLPVAFGRNDSAERGLSPGWEDRILFEAATSPYTSGLRRSGSSQSLPAGTMRLSYRILAASGGSGHAAHDLQGTVRIWIHHFLPVARAAEDIPAGTRLRESMLGFSEEDISLMQSSYLIRGEAFSEYMTLASFKSGQRIEAARLQRVQAVRAGDRVMITVTRSGLRVSLPGRAFRSGSIGDIIDVRPEAAAKRFPARITGSGEVLIENQ